jgi:Flp pilus assembly protein TadB
MKESTQLRILSIVILVVFAFIDALPFTALTAFALIIMVLFRPKWFRDIINKFYD